MEQFHQTNITFDGIKDRVIMNEKQTSNKKKIIWGSIGGGLLTAGVACALVLTINATSKPNGPSSHLVPSDAKFSLKAVAENITPFVSSALNQNGAQSLIRQRVNTFLLTEGKTDEQFVHELLYQFDTIIENDDNYTVEAVASDREDYKFKEIITFVDLLGNKNSYSLYYNDVKVEEEKDDDEIEKESVYSGIAVKEDQEFRFKLELEEENEEDEHEVESTFYLFNGDNKSTYTKITSSCEIEDMEKETQYSYEIYENGNKVLSYEMEIEVDPEDNETELSVELNEKEYSIERFKEGKDTYFHVEIENDDTDEESEWLYKKVINGETVSYVLVD